MNDTDPAPETDPIVAIVEDALAPYRGLLPPEDLQAMREELWYLLEDHPVMQRMVAKLRHRPAPQASGEVSREGAADDDAAVTPIRRTGGKTS